MELEHEAGARAVEHMRYVCEPPAQKPRPRSIFIYFRPFKVEEKFQEVTALTTETKIKHLKIFQVFTTVNKAANVFWDINSYIVAVSPAEGYKILHREKYSPPTRCENQPT
jgi:hypothetical protein